MSIIDVRLTCKKCSAVGEKHEVNIKLPIYMVKKNIKEIGLPSEFKLEIREAGKDWEVLS